jgi:hypothetical protein
VAPFGFISAALRALLKQTAAAAMQSLLRSGRTMAVTAAPRVRAMHTRSALSAAAAARGPASTPTAAAGTAASPARRTGNSAADIRRIFREQQRQAAVAREAFPWEVTEQKVTAWEPKYEDEKKFFYASKVQPGKHNMNGRTNYNKQRTCTAFIGGATLQASSHVFRVWHCPISRYILPLMPFSVPVCDCCDAFVISPSFVALFQPSSVVTSKSTAASTCCPSASCVPPPICPNWT